MVAELRNSEHAKLSFPGLDESIPFVPGKAEQGVGTNSTYMRINVVRIGGGALDMKP